MAGKPTTAQPAPKPQPAPRGASLPERVLAKWRAGRPDRSREGFAAACDMALESVEPYDWHSIDELLVEISTVVGDALRLDVRCDFIATLRTKGHPRVVIRAGGYTRRHDLRITLDAAARSSKPH